MTATPITDLVEKLLAADVLGIDIVEAARILELALSTRRQVDSPPDSQPDRIERRRQYEREYRRKWRAKSKAASTGQSTGQVDSAPLSKKGKRDSQRVEVEVRKKNTDSVNGRAGKTRLPDDWAPSEKDWNFAAQNGLRADQIDTEALKFRNYWTNRTDRDSRKPRWDLAWQNWILNMRGEKHGKSRRTLTDECADLYNEARELERNAGIGRPSDSF